MVCLEFHNETEKKGWRKMAWWIKGLIGSVVGIALIFAGGFLMEGSMSDDAISELCGSLCGSALVVIWIVAFLTRKSPKAETNNDDYLDEKELLGTRPCNYFKSSFCLLIGKGSVTTQRVIWKPANDLFNKLQSMIYRAQPISLPLSEITEATQSKHGLNKNILSIQTTSGMEYRFQVDNVTQWLETLKKPESVG